ncbi:MAG: hypothetical protein V4619_10685 [Bacteroidota bacterium]
MKRILILTIVTAAMFTVAACKKNVPAPINPGSSGATGTTGATGSTGPTGVVKTSPEPGVYVVGYKTLGDMPVDVRAAIWKDNNPYQLSSLPSAANAICVQDTNVYVAGYEYQESLLAIDAVYWVNNKQMVNLTSNPKGGVGKALGIGTVGKDIYVAGSIGSLAVYWKNGDLVKLPITTGAPSAATGMVVKGNDVYICGYYGATAPAAHLGACYWKNGVLYGTTDNVNESKATAIAVDDDGNVYLSGYINGTVTPRKGGYYQPAFWKNNELTKLPNPDKLAGIANGIGVTGGNIYVSGTSDDGTSRDGAINPKGVLWTNGTPKNIGNSLAGGWLAVAQGDVFVSGLRPIDTFTKYAAIWKGNDIVAQGSQTTFNALYVVK